MTKLRVCLLVLAAVGCVSDPSDAKNTKPDAGLEQPPTSGAGGDAAHGGGGAGAIDGGDASGDTGTTSPDNGGSGGSSTAGRSGSSGGGAGAGGSAGAAGGGVDLSAELFDPDKLPRFDIELSSDAQTSLGNDPTTYVKGTFRYGTTTLNDVGVRIKGEASLRTLEQKAAFKLKFDEFTAKQELLGLRRLTLNNMVSDPSFIAERLVYQVFKAAGLPGPRCNNALVYVNNEFYGVYANVESEDKPFLRRWFASDAGNLYEDGQIDFEPGNESFFELQTNETANDRSDLTALISALAAAGGDSYLTDLNKVLDTDHYLHYAALEAAVNQWDGYSYTYFEPNNFRIYHDPSRGQFVFLPWGMDMALKPFPDTTLAQIPLFTIPRYEDRAADDPKGRDAGGLIWKNCMQSATCKARFGQVAHEIADLFESLNLEAVAAHHYAQIKDHVYEETRKEVSNQDFEAGYQTVLTTLRNRPKAMRSDLTAAGL